MKPETGPPTVSSFNHCFFTSLTRITDLRDRLLSTRPVAREEWRNGDYVACEVANQSPIPLELASGRQVQAVPGDLIVGALGRRCATLEAVGSFEDVGEDLQLEALTGAGLLGKATSVSAMLPELIRLRYRGHVCADGRPARMVDYRLAPSEASFVHPVLLIVGTSMSAGKTTTARVLVRLLKEQGQRVIGAKLTGAGRYRDILSIKDAGADCIFDFVDAGLPSTACPREEFIEAGRLLLGKMAEQEADVVVIEAGASPLEPYNGAAAMELLGAQVCFTVLCAADPYSVIGVTRAFGIEPDLVCGLATSTSAGIELIERLSGIPAVDVLDPAARTVLRDLTASALGRFAEAPPER